MWPSPKEAGLQHAPHMYVRLFIISAFLSPRSRTLQLTAHCRDRVAREEMFDIGQRPDVADILVVITDGMSDEPNATWIEAMNTRARNISIIAVSTSHLSFVSCSVSRTVFYGQSSSTVLWL